jgi:hypothetical protein
MAAHVVRRHDLLLIDPDGEDAVAEGVAQFGIGVAEQAAQLRGQLRDGAAFSFRAANPDCPDF